MESGKAQKLIWKITIWYLVLLPMFLTCLQYGGMVAGSPSIKEWQALPLLFFYALPLLSIFFVIPLAWVFYVRKKFSLLQKIWKIPLILLGGAMLVEWIIQSIVYFS